MNKKKIAIIAGGYSSERGISLNSANQIKQVLDREKYEVFTVLISKDIWEVCFDDGCNLIINRDDFSFNFNGQKIKFDMALISIHGTPGEDGLLQSYFELVGLPYSTGDVLSTSLSFNKFACKTYLKNFDVLTANAVLIRKGQEFNPKKVIKITKLPCFVKPNAGGSSYGVSKVRTEEELMPAIEKAFLEDKEVIVEQFIKGTEITCGVLKTKELEILLPVTEIASKNEYFDTEAKYEPGMCDEITPARIPLKMQEKCQEISSRIYDALNFRGVTRMDFILSGEQMYFLEANVTPGMSAASIIPKQLKVHGMTMGEMFDIIIEDSLNNSQ